MTRHFSQLRRIAAALGLCACSAAAAPPQQVMVTREVQDLYRVSTGTYYMKTIGCYEQIFGDRADLRLNISGRGGMLLFRNGHTCVVDKFLVEIEASKLPRPTLF